MKSKKIMGLNFNPEQFIHNFFEVMNERNLLNVRKEVNKRVNILF